MKGGGALVWLEKLWLRNRHGVVGSHLSANNLAASLSVKSTRSIMIISGEPAATKYCRGDGAGYLLRPLYGPFFRRALSSGRARSMGNFCVRRGAQWTQYLDYRRDVCSRVGKQTPD